jgi:isochorismate synthase
MADQLAQISSPIIILESKELSKIISRLLRSNFAFGALKQSQNSNFLLSISQIEEVKFIDEIGDLAENNIPSGFVAFPFDNRKTKGIFIPNLIDLTEIEHIDPKNEIDKEKETYISNSENHYKEGVSKAIESIQKGNFQKLVFSRKLEIPFALQSVELLVDDLINKYPEAHLCFFNIPGEGFWISASPEILLEKKPGIPILETMALAGTMPFEGQNLKNQGWTEKEIEEQAMVSRFMKEKFVESGHLEFEEKGPITIQAGNLLHLRTDYKVKTVVKNSFIFLAQSLHPTSAVCGSPRNEAFDWLAENEDFDRSFFSGFAGIIGQDYGKLIVLLRSAKLQNGKATLFSGAGITACSKPENEWLETEEKMKTLLAVIQ